MQCRLAKKFFQGGQAIGFAQDFKKPLIQTTGIGDIKTYRKKLSLESLLSLRSVNATPKPWDAVIEHCGQLMYCYLFQH